MKRNLITIAKENKDIQLPLGNLIENEYYLIFKIKDNFYFKTVDCFSEKKIIPKAKKYFAIEELNRPDDELEFIGVYYAEGKLFNKYKFYDLISKKDVLLPI